MKIYIIPAWYPDSNRPFHGSFIHFQAHALANTGIDVTVIKINYKSIKNSCNSKDNYVFQDGKVRTFFKSVVIPIPSCAENIQGKYISKQFYKIIRNQINEDVNKGLGRPDLIHSHVSHSCAYYCLYAKKKLNIPLVVTEHYSGLLLGTASERDYKRVGITINNADAFIFVGSNFQKTICQKFNIQKQTYVLPNMIDTDQYYIKSTIKDSFVFFTACHLKKNKSVDLVVKAFHRAFEKEESVKLMIAGDGPEFDSISNLIEELGESDRISMLGKYSKEESGGLFSNADAFVLTSRVETFGIVYIEALASGVPCIGTKGQGADDIINESNGFLVQYGDIEELADRMKDLSQNRDSYDNSAIRKDCISRFDYSSVCNQIEELYKTIVSKNSK